MWRKITMSGVTVALNQVQKIPEVPIIPRRIVVQPHTWYTCPAGKKARVFGRIMCTGRGAASTVDFDFPEFTKYRWTGGTLDSTFDYLNNRPLSLANPDAIASEFPFEIELAAGESIQTNQNTGTNAEINLNAEVFETPA